MTMRLSLMLKAVAALAAMGIGAAAPAQQRPRVDVSPYLEAAQVLNADLNDGDVLTYTALAAGVDGRVATRRVEAQISYRYEHRIPWNGELASSDVHSGVAQAQAQIIPNMLVMNAGAMATRSRSDGRAPIFGFGRTDSLYLADVYSVYAGPDLSARVGPAAVNGSYRIGYVKVEDRSRNALPVTIPAFGRYNSSVTQSASASIGMSPRDLPFGWTVGGGWVREDLNRLDQDFEGKYIRADLVVPVSHSLALTAGVGYEDMQASQQDIVRNSNGTPAIGPDGELIADPSKPRLLSYDQQGVIWDAGVIWRPNRRTELQGRVGERYGGTTFTGSFTHKFNSAYAMSFSVFDTIDSFGRRTVANLAGLPVNFRIDPFRGGGAGIGGCLFGNDPGTGICLDNAFQAIATANFRNRGANFIFSGGRGPWSFGVGAGYSNRRYYTPDVFNGFELQRIIDESFTLSANLQRRLSRNSGIGIDGYAAWSDSSIPGYDGAFGTGITGSYYQSLFVDRLQGHAAVGLYTTQSEAFDSTVASGQVGLRYTF